MIKELKSSLFLIFLFLQFNLFAQRAENEQKYDLSNEDLSSIVNRFKEISKDKKLIKNQLGINFSVSLSKEVFYDLYFDNKNLYFYKNQMGLRERKRFLGSFEDQSEKFLKKTIQFKIPSNKDDLIRFEYKFDAAPINAKVRSFYDKHPFLSKVSEDDRDQVFFIFKKFEINWSDLIPVLKIKQIRQRLYISKDFIPYMTLTADSVEGDIDSSEKSIFLNELEVEINEVLYTQASLSEKKSMEHFSNSLLQKLTLGKIASDQNQLPKYNKVMDLFLKDNPKLELKLSQETNNHYAYIAIVIFLIIFFYLLFKKVKD